ncbi:MAG: ankyrin repeat domain-containing protein [Gammaproteobacteria bacterium]|nr:ankyrin repeat domain-containing protein [Gammaproteobacteria bacterium]
MDTSTENALLDAALAGDDALADAIMADASEWKRSIPCRLAVADPDAVNDLDDGTVNAGTGPNAWPPLLYLVNSRYRNDDDANRSARLDIAKALLDLGADPNTGTRESETIRGYRTALGGAIGRARNPDLAKLLLAAGAHIADGPTLYEGSAMWEAVRHRDLESLEVLLGYDPPQWHACHALPHCLAHNDLGFVRLLLDHDADPNWTMGTWGFKGNCLHEAVVLDNDSDIVEALLGKDADVHFRDRGGRTPLAVATCLNRDTHLALLRRSGADEDHIRTVDRWVSACFAGDEQNAARGWDRSGLTPIDHAWLCRAVRMGNNDAVRLLLGGDVDPDAVDDDGNRALHVAASEGNTVSVEYLIDAGADTRAVNYAGETPFDVAQRSTGASSDAVLALLAPHRPRQPSVLYDDADFAAVYERAADAVVDGDIGTLDRLLRANPVLATARSARPHRCTLLHYLGANGIEGHRQKTPANAVEVIDRLFAAGADPNASCYTYRGGPDETTVGLLTSSGHPRDAGLTVSMVSALAKGGARVPDVYRLLGQLVDRDPQQVDGFDPESDLAAQAVLECAGLREREMLFALIDSGVDVNARRGDGATALHQAAIDGDSQLVDALLDRGADLSLRDTVYDGTAAGWAFAGGHEELGRKLAGRLARLASTRAV